MQTYLDFEKGLAEIEGKAEELRALARKNAEMDVEAEAQALDRKADTLLDDLYREHAAWTGDYVDGHVAEAVAWAEANHALKVTALTAEDAAALRATAEPLIQGYVARMAAKGIDGQAVVDFIRGR